jgi:hypothetical protein
MFNIKNRDTLEINGHELCFPTPISRAYAVSNLPEERNNPKDNPYHVFEIQGIVVVCIYPETDLDVEKLKLYKISHPEYSSNRNVWAFDANGNKIWEIEAIREATILGQSAPYTALEIRNGKIYAFNWVGYDCEIDPLTGKILSEEYYR